MRRTDISEAQTVVVAIRGVVVDWMTFPAGELAEAYKFGVRRWSRERGVSVTIWTQTAASGRGVEPERRAPAAIAV